MPELVLHPQNDHLFPLVITLLNPGQTVQRWRLPLGQKNNEAGIQEKGKNNLTIHWKILN
jgi:hypothetical protein